MNFLSKVKKSRKLIIIIFSIFVLMFTGLYVLNYYLRMQIDLLTNANYFPPEVETMFLAEINISESEVLSLEVIENAIRDVKEKKVEINDDFMTYTDYESMPDGIQVLIDEFLEGVIRRKNGEVTREELIPDFQFYILEHYISISFSYSSMRHTYTYFPGGEISKKLRCGFTKGIDTIYHAISNNEMYPIKDYGFRTYWMTNTGEFISKGHLTNLNKKSYDEPDNIQISVEDYNLFHSDYLKGKIPGDFILTIKNMNKYIDRTYH